MPYVVANNGWGYCPETYWIYTTNKRTMSDNNMTIDVIETQYVSTEPSLSEVALSGSNNDTDKRESAATSKTLSTYVVDLTHDNIEPVSWFVYGCIPQLEILSYDLDTNGPPLYRILDPIWEGPRVVVAETKWDLYTLCKKYGRKVHFIAGPFWDVLEAYDWLDPITRGYNLSSPFFPEQSFHAMNEARTKAIKFDIENAKRRVNLHRKILLKRFLSTIPYNKKAYLYAPDPIVNVIENADLARFINQYI